MNHQPNRHFKAIIAYDGTDYHGWQLQPEHVTISSTLASTFNKVFHQPISIFGASRTDAGVHALGQVARCTVEHPDKLPSLENLTIAWNNRLPHSIRIIRCEPLSDDFHPGANVIEKKYSYALFLRPPLPLVARYGWYYPFIKEIDFHQFATVINCYRGTHDFASFCTYEPGKTTIRTINQIAIKIIRHYNVGVVTVKGPGFARFQIRRMIGSALDLCRRTSDPVSAVRELLNNPCHEQTFTKAEAAGLCLRTITYGAP